MSVQLRLPFAPPIRGPISRSTIYRVQPESLGESGALARVGGTVDRNHHGLVHTSKSAYCTLACAGVQFQPETVQEGTHFSHKALRMLARSVVIRGFLDSYPWMTAARTILGSVVLQRNFPIGEFTRTDPETTLAVARFPARKHDLNQKDLKSATIQAAPVIRKVRPNSDQFRCVSG